MALTKVPAGMIGDDTAQLENADGVLMSAEEAKAFVATLP